MNRIKEIRKQLGLTVRNLSEKADVATGYVSVLENDVSTSTNPTKEVMEKISKALGKTVPEIFYPNSEEQKGA